MKSPPGGPTPLVRPLARMPASGRGSRFVVVSPEAEMTDHDGHANPGLRDAGAHDVANNLKECRDALDRLAQPARNRSSWARRRRAAVARAIRGPGWGRRPRSS